MSQKDEGFNQANDELLKALIDKAVDNGKGINDIKEMLRRQTDLSAALQDVGKTVSGQAERMDRSHARIEEINADVKKIVQQTARDGSAEALRGEIVGLREFLRQPVKKEMHYKYFLGKPLLVHVPMIMLIGVLSALLVRNIGRADDHEANDMKWRYVKLNAVNEAQGYLSGIEERYRADPRVFTNEVVEEEDRRQQLFQKKLEEEKTRGDIKALEEKRKMR